MSLTTGWDNFLSAAASASAALSGLVFVAVSLSLRVIVDSAQLRGRAIETLIQFLLVLVVALCGLIPGQSDIALGSEIASCGVVVWVVVVLRHMRAHRDTSLAVDARRWLWLRIVAGQASTLPFAVAGALLVAGHDRAIAWVAPGTLASFAAGALNAWVLLVEIQR